MPKKSANSRATAQRQKAKAQKGFELVRPATAEAEEEIAPLPTRAPAATATLPETEEYSAEPIVPATPKGGSAAARMAARRQAGARVQQQRNSASLITAEHFAYVRKDLIFIAILAVLMIAIIIGGYVILGRNF
ncbi:hypothetical protein [Tengunoibacter tsumagoiensis]|uniref:Uncharacterized protein n=1 Tax=Tengunoibacter tsumagoiensis TaxID=2014871 RepID=A0A401ZXU9_9CHLR|nr:hypothetical protein [Tengunoibacter tsumagoiensis]GCE11662.1 hypothetical protein KTT_15210 [Tengunoibacter tsumagoiensis]